MVLFGIIYSFLTLQKECFSYKALANMIIRKEKLLVLIPGVNKMFKINIEVTKHVSENCL